MFSNQLKQHRKRNDNGATAMIKVDWKRGEWMVVCVAGELFNCMWESKQMTTCSNMNGQIRKSIFDEI